jgi:hypothetical protein
MVYESEEFYEILKGVIVDGLRHPLYEIAVEHEEQMAVHVLGTKPVKLLERTRPREEAEVRDYRIESYEPMTKAGSDKSLHIIQKIFAPGLSSVTWKDEDKNEDVKELKSYTLEYYPKHNSLQNFNKEVLLKKLICDPNGVAAVKPSKIPTSQTQTVRPIIVTYGSKKVWYMVEMDYYLINVGEREDENGKYYMFEYYDTSVYAKFESSIQRNSQGKDEMIFTQKEFYQHNFKDKDGYGEVPAWPLKGVSQSLDNGDIFYESFFYPAVPYWNRAITHESDLFGAYINHLHPIRAELSQECDYVYPYQGTSYQCRGGRVTAPVGLDAVMTPIECPGCHGSGMKSVRSPYGVYQYNKEKLDEGGSQLKPVEFITVPTEPTKMLDERVDKMIKRGMWAINMDVEDKVGENQSGVAKEIDRSAQRDTLADVATLIFDYHLQNEYYFINKYMFATEASSAGKEEDGNLPQINKPTKYVVSSPAELLAAFEAASKAGVSGIVSQIKQQEYVNEDLSTNPELREYANTLLMLDPLPGMTVDDINVAESKGFISKQSAVIHFNLKEFVDRAISEDSEFVSKTKEEKLEILKGMADEHIAENKTTLAPTIPTVDEG